MTLLLGLGDLARQATVLPAAAPMSATSWAKGTGGSAATISRAAFSRLSTRRTLIWVIRGAIPGILARTSIWVAPTEETFITWANEPSGGR